MSSALITPWIHELVHGPGGIHDQVNRGDGSGCDGSNPETCCCVEAAGFAVRALANPRCEGSAEVLAAIQARRSP